MSLSLNLFGSFYASRDGKPVTRFRGNKVRGLLAYLATEAQQCHSRISLATLFWPDRPDELALRNLAQALVRLRDALGDADGTLLQVTRHSIQWHGPAVVDVLEFSRLADSPDSADLEAALAYYRGEFLAGFALDGCETFEEWLLLTRERMEQRALLVLEQLADRYLSAGDFVAARTAARRQLELDPWRETAYRQLMRALANGGDRAAALAAFERCQHVLATDLDAEPDPATVSLAATIRCDGAGSPAPVRNCKLPAPLTVLFGREEELATLDSLLRGGVRMVTVFGTGGVGKTRLAMAAAHVLRHAFAAGVCWVSLSELNAGDTQTQCDRIAAAILAAMGQQSVGSRSSLAGLRDAVGEHGMLLALDNCEHLPAVGNLVADLLASCPRLHVLATSRERLGVYGEELLVLEGLPLPAEDEDAARSAAVQLFLAHAGRHLNRYSAELSDVAAAARLCRVLEGMPLGIELAAQWVHHFSCDEIARVIQTDLAFFETRDRHVPERHRSLRAVFDYSWGLLNIAERRVLMRLGVFPGSFDRAAAEQIAGASMHVLATLVDKSLLRRIGPGRYTMHRLLRQFVATQLQKTPDEYARVRNAYSAFYLALVAAHSECRPDGVSRTAAVVTAELHNIRHAWYWSMINGESQQAAHLQSC